METNGRPVMIVGVGGHARVVLYILQASGLRTAAVVGQPTGRASAFGDVPVIASDEEALAQAKEADMTFVVAVGDNARRRSLYERFRSEGLPASCAVHPTAVLATGAECGEGTVVGAMAVIAPYATVGANAVINTGAIVEHDCSIADHANIAPGVRMGGDVSVGEAALIGMGAVVLPGVTVGAEAVVGAGAVVLRDVPPNTTVVGVPAKPLEGDQAPCTV